LAYPQSVTAQMLTNMARGIPAVSVLAEALTADLELIMLGTVSERLPVIQCRHVTPSTKDSHANRPC